MAHEDHDDHPLVRLDGITPQVELRIGEVTPEPRIEDPLVGLTIKIPVV
jgi:hypothetical protein